MQVSVTFEWKFVVGNSGGFPSAMLIDMQPGLSPWMMLAVVEPLPSKMAPSNSIWSAPLWRTMRMSLYGALSHTRFVEHHAPGPALAPPSLMSYIRT